MHRPQPHPPAKMLLRDSLLPSVQRTMPRPASSAMLEGTSVAARAVASSPAGSISASLAATTGWRFWKAAASCAASSCVVGQCRSEGGLVWEVGWLASWLVGWLAGDGAGEA